MTMKKLTTFILAALLPPLALAGISEYPNISDQDLKQVVASKQATLLDLSGTDTFNAGHIPGAIDFAADKDNLNAYLPPGKEVLIVVYCHTGACPDYTTAAGAAVDLGYTNVKFYAPGLAGWVKAGGRVEKSPPVK